MKGLVVAVLGGAFALGPPLGMEAGLWGGAVARAHGTIPTSNSIGFLPDGTVFLGTNFGGILRLEGRDEFICETSVTGTQQALDAWRVTSAGRIAAVALSGDFMRGLYVSGPGGCGFALAEGSADLLVAGIAADGADVLVAGRWPESSPCEDCREVGVVLRWSPDEGLAVVASGLEGRPATGVVVGEGERVAVFSGGGRGEVVRLGGAQTRVEVALAAGETLVPLGVAGVGGEAELILVVRGEGGDRIVSSRDFGATLSERGSIIGRVAGFAAAGGRIWLQSPQRGLFRSDGGAFSEVATGPHGGCLAAREGRLWACGVPWQDGFALGVSEDGGESFMPAMRFYDSIARATACAGTTAICDEELVFLRGYYGFSDPAVVEPGPEVVEAGADVGPDAEPPAEAGPEVSPERGVELAEPRASGCGGGGASGVTWGWLLAAAIVSIGAGRWGAARRVASTRGCERTT